jgi:uncharacterized protein YaaN involved in tellurite resistance
MSLRFEKKLYDLELTRNISIQMAPQIRMIQNNDSLMAEKIQTTIVNNQSPFGRARWSSPWDSPISQEAMEAQRAVSDTTNELLKKNADALKLGTPGNGKGIGARHRDIETLQVHQPVPHQHAGRGSEDPAGGKRSAPPPRRSLPGSKAN